MFIHFREEDSKVQEPNDKKGIGKLVTCNNKSGCMVKSGWVCGFANDHDHALYETSILPSMIILNGILGGRLMKEWSKHTNSFVLGPEMHKMTSQKMVL